MTKGKIIFIDDIYTFISTEFNGDMMPDRNGEDIINEFKNHCLDTDENYKHFINKFNKKYFNYDKDDLIKDYYIDNYLLDISNNWTDFLYIINQSDNIYTIKTKDDLIELQPYTLGIFNFQSFVDAIKQNKTEQISFTKEDFVNYINCLKEDEEFFNSLYSLCKRRQDIIDIFPLTMQNFVDLLKIIMNDTDDYIWQWCYDYDFGEKDMYINNKLIKSPEDLFDAIK